FRPQIAAAGLVQGSGVTIEIAGIEITRPDETCVDADGRNWPCGVRARTAFRAFVRGRALVCDLPQETDAERHTVACSLGKQDVGEWLVRHGWARALDGGPYRQAGQDARAAGLGVFGPGPDTAPMQTSPDAEAVAAPQNVALP